MSKCFFWVVDKCQYQNMLKKTTEPCPLLKDGECIAKTPEDFAQVLAKYNQEMSYHG